MIIEVFPSGQLRWRTNAFRCALGRGGVTRTKVEGDGATPVGRFPLRRLHVRADRLPEIATSLPHRAIRRTDGWCDDPAELSYNQLIQLPFFGSHEAMWRADGLYDLVVEIGYNDDPPKPGLGSAIFMHVAKPGYQPTDGCVALALQDLKSLLAEITPSTEINIHASG